MKPLPVLFALSLLSTGCKPMPIDPTAQAQEDAKFKKMMRSIQGEQVGRYQLQQGTSSIALFDTATGNMWVMGSGSGTNWVAIPSPHKED